MSSLLPASAALSPLEKFISDFFKAVVIQDDEKVFQEAMHRDVSRHVKESDNGKPLNFTQFLQFVENLRAGLSQRNLVSESFVVGTPTDPHGKSGAIAHISHVSGTQEGKKVKSTIVSVLNVHWVDDSKEEHLEITTTQDSKPGIATTSAG